MTFKNKVAVVTGAAQGIGAAVAIQLAQGGASVALLDLQLAEHTEATIQWAGGKAKAWQVDIAQSAAIAQALTLIEAELGPIDILVNVAGILRPSSILALSDEDWDATFAVNAGGVFRLSRAVAQRMVPRKTGTIITVGSNAASVPRLQMAAYAASKAAATQFTRCLALELAPHGIRCNIVSPGSTDTAMQRDLWTSPDSEQIVIRGSPENYRLGIPLGRIADPADIAAAVCFLASDAARQITMHDLRVDGGATLDA